MVLAAALEPGAVQPRKQQLRGRDRVAGRSVGRSVGTDSQGGSQGIAKKHTPNATVIDIRHLAN